MGRNLASRIQGILFDKDGTLVDYEATWSPLNRVAAEYAAAGDRTLADRLLEIGGHDAENNRVRGGSLLAACHTREIAAAWIDAGAPHELDGLVAAMDAIFADGAVRAVPVADIAGLFERLRRRGLAVGVATSDSEAAARRTLDHLNVLTRGVFVAGYDSGHGGKPDPGMVHAFARAAGISPSAVAVVGDNLHDLDMARAAGCGLAIGVLTGTECREALAGRADAVLNSVADLEALLDA